MDDPLYSTEILRWTSRLRADHRLKAPDFSVTRTSRVCGSRLALDIAEDGAGRIANLGHQVKACAIGQAASAFFLTHLPGLTKTEARDLADAFEGFIRNGAALDVPVPWDGLEIFRPVQDHRSRHDAALLPAEAIRAWFNV